jgi:hypothetical protein
MAFPNKKPGMDVMIAVGKKPQGGLPSPNPIEGLGKKPDPQEESAESPEYESSEDQGAKLISDIESAGQKHGLEPDSARSFAADVFSAMAECLRGGEPQGDEGARQEAPEEEGVYR